MTKPEAGQNRGKQSRFFAGAKTNTKANAKTKQQQQPTTTAAGEDDCVQEFKAFARGGNYSLGLLNRVWPSIMQEYAVPEQQLDRLLDKAGLWIKLGKIRSFRHEEEDVPQWHGAHTI
jgi:hypothetical protein